MARLERAEVFDPNKKLAQLKVAQLKSLKSHPSMFVKALDFVSTRFQNVEKSVGPC